MPAPEAADPPRLSTRLKQAYEAQMSNPTWLSIAINPYYFIRRGLANGVKRHAPALTGKLLDFGCGSQPYRHLFQVDEYIGLDIEESGHSNTYKKADYFYDGHTIPFGDRQFDSIFSSEVLEHVFNLEHILTELHRVLKDEGQLLITVPFVWDEHEIPYDFARYTSFGLTHLLKQHGFTVIAQEKTTTYVETIFQMWNAYVVGTCFPASNRLLRVGLTVLLLFPVNVVGSILSKLLPKNVNFYHNNVILARKTVPNL
jgi:SAM-dependent methyltransferase